MVTINYDSKNFPTHPWIVLGRFIDITRYATLEAAIACVTQQVTDEPHEFLLYDLFDRSWGIGIVDDDADRYGHTLDSIGTYPHSELVDILLTYGQMLPCKSRS